METDKNTQLEKLIDQDIRLLKDGIGWMENEDADLVLFNRDEIYNILNGDGRGEDARVAEIDALLREYGDTADFNLVIPDYAKEDSHWWWYLWTKQS